MIKMKKNTNNSFKNQTTMLMMQMPAREVPGSLCTQDVAWRQNTAEAPKHFQFTISSVLGNSFTMPLGQKKYLKVLFIEQLGANDFGIHGDLRGIQETVPQKN